MHVIVTEDIILQSYGKYLVTNYIRILCVLMCLRISQHINILFAIVPTYCWQTPEIQVSAGIGEMHVEFVVSFNRSGSTFPTYISKQCAYFISQHRSGKLEMGTNVCFTVTKIYNHTIYR